MNATIERFGYPATLVADAGSWVVLLRAAQPTLGSLILAAKGDATAFADLSEQAFIDLGRAISSIETTLKRAVNYERLNYLMLMMVDPHVHFHVLPRYEGQRTACGISVVDAGWPRAPALDQTLALEPPQIAELTGWLRRQWDFGA